MHGDDATHELLFDVKQGLRKARPFFPEFRGGKHYVPIVNPKAELTP